MTTGRKRRTTPDQLLYFFMLFLGLSGILGIVMAGLMLPATAAAGMVSRTATDSFQELPDEFKLLQPSEQSTLLAADGSLIANFYAEDRIVVSSEAISQPMKQAIVAVEDRRFYLHHGVDSQGMFRALLSNLSGGQTQGASTLTQQLVKNTLIENGLQRNDRAAIEKAKEPTIGRKIREMNYAIALEKRWSKDQILTRYLNIAPFGSNVYGVEAAALQYFSVHAKDLDKSQAALLAGITQSPVAFDPLRHPQAAQKRRDQVARKMLEQGVVNQQEFDQIVATNVKDILHPSDRPTGCAAAGNAAYYCELAVARALDNPKLGKTKSERRRILMRGGINIKTTLDRRRQDAAFEALTKRVPVGDPSGFKAALTSIEPGTGNIVAMAQTTTFGTPTESNPGADFVSYNADLAGRGSLGRPTGSSFKTMTIGAWFETGHSAYEVVGGKTNFKSNDFGGDCEELSKDWGPWHVTNVEGVSTRPTNIVRGTNLSINTTFAAMGSKIHDLCKIAGFAKKLGAVDGKGEIRGFTPPSIIGTLNVPPMNMANAYATLAAEGKRCQPRVIDQIADSKGKVLVQTKPQCQQTVDPMVAKKVNRVLNLNNDFYKRNGYGNAGRPAASKTGTTNNATNAWMLGYTPQLATAVWVGNPKGEVPMINVRIGGTRFPVVYGSTIPASVWSDFTRVALEGQPALGFEPVSLGDKSKRSTAKHTGSSRTDKPKSNDSNSEQHDSGDDDN